MAKFVVEVTAVAEIGDPGPTVLIEADTVEQAEQIRNAIQGTPVPTKLIVDGLHDIEYTAECDDLYTLEQWNEDMGIAPDCTFQDGTFVELDQGEAVNEQLTEKENDHE